MKSPVETSEVTTPQIMASASRMKKDVIKITRDFSPRDHTNLSNLDLLSEYIRNAWNATGATVEFQYFKANKKRYRNVIALFGPQDKKRIVVGAHFDAFEKLPGADDNASGVAGLMELGRLLSKARPKDFSIELVAYNLEEPPYFRTAHMGSAHHVKKLLEEKRKIPLMINLEMIGYYSDKKGSQEYPVPLLKLFYPNKGNYVLLASNTQSQSELKKLKRALMNYAKTPIESISAPSFIKGIDFSDHLNYWAAEIPAIMITDTSFYRNKNYHTPEDLHSTLDYNKMADLISALHSALLELKI